MLADGGWNAAVGPEREGAFWFQFAGLMMIVIGLLVRQTVRRDGRLPAALGAVLLVGTVPAAAFLPASGVWLLIGTGLLACAPDRRGARPSSTTGHPGRRARAVPRLLWAVCALHLAAAPIGYHRDLTALVTDGVWNSVHGPGRELAFWFVIGGTMLAMITFLIQETVRSTGALPEHLGVVLIAFFLPPTLLMPGSGLWLLLAIGLLALTDRSGPTAPHGTGSPSTPAALPLSPT
jgi:hypothetical protein